MRYLLLALLLLLLPLPLPLPVSAADYQDKSGPGCDSPEAVKAIYPLLDAMPDHSSLIEVVAMFVAAREKGILCEFILAPEPLAEIGVVGTFTRTSDGTTMDIVKYERQGGKPPTYSWREAKGTSL
jgi:hypothetical protein